MVADHGFVGMLFGEEALPDFYDAKKKVLNAGLNAFPDIKKSKKSEDMKALIHDAAEKLVLNANGGYRKFYIEEEIILPLTDGLYIAGLTSDAEKISRKIVSTMQAEIDKIPSLGNQQGAVR